MTEPTQRKTRKRRSFWEPSSPELIAWLNSQADLGTSLQLIIVDAMRRYGEGDAVQAYLQQRIDGEIDGDMAVLPPVKQKPNIAPVVEAAETSPEIDVADVLPDVTDTESERVLAKAPDPTPEPIAPSPPRPAPKVEQPKPVTAPLLNDDEPYDPLETMFQDVDSEMR